MGLTAYVVSRGVSKGIEKAAKLLMPTLILMILSLAVYAFTLPNAMEGLKFYLVPDFSEINGKVAYNALGQAFFSLSLGMGALITYGSYVNKKENIVSAAALITLADVGMAFIAGLMIFPLIAYMSQGTMEGVGAGPELIFVTLPKIFETLGPTLGVIVGTGFFVLLSFAALTSTVSLLEVPVAYVVDELQVRRKKATWIMAVIIFLVSVPSLLSHGYSGFFGKFVTYLGAESPTNFMTFVADVANDTLLPLGGCLIAFFAAHVWKKHNLNEELSHGAKGYKGSVVEKYLNLTIGYICPLILAFMFVATVLGRFFGIDII